MCTAFTVSPSSGKLNGICSLSTRWTTPRFTAVFGAITVGVEITVVPPILRDPIVVVPTEPSHVVVDVASIDPIVTAGIASSDTDPDPTELTATDSPGYSVVSTDTHRFFAPTGPATLATHGGVTVDEAVVSTAPVSGVGAMWIGVSAAPSARRPNARPVFVCGSTSNDVSPHSVATATLLRSPS